MTMPLFFQRMSLVPRTLAETLETETDRRCIIRHMLIHLNTPADIDTMRVILYYLDKTGISITEVAQATGYSDNVLRDWLASLGYPSMADYDALSRFLIPALTLLQAQPDD